MPRTKNVKINIYLIFIVLENKQRSNAKKKTAKLYITFVESVMIVNMYLSR